MSNDDQKFVFHKLIKTASKSAVKQGLLKAELPGEVADFLAEQLSFTYDLLKKGHKIDGKTLSVLLAQKALSGTRLALSGKHECAIAFLFLTVSFAKAVSATTMGPVGLSVTAFELVKDTYTMGNTCSAPVQQKITEVAAPAYGWLESGIMQALSRGHL